MLVAFTTGNILCGILFLFLILFFIFIFILDLSSINTLANFLYFNVNRRS